jgi:hypothetical protein
VSGREQAPGSAARGLLLAPPASPDALFVVSAVLVAVGVLISLWLSRLLIPVNSHSGKKGHDWVASRHSCIRYGFGQGMEQSHGLT